VPPEIIYNYVAPENGAEDDWYNYIPNYAKGLDTEVSDRMYSNLRYFKYYVTSLDYSFEEKYGTVTENNDGIIEFNQVWDVATSALLQGTNNIYIKIADRAGNIVTKSITLSIKYDDIPPIVDDSLVTDTIYDERLWIDNDNYMDFLNTVNVSFFDSTSLLKEIAYKIEYQNGTTTSIISSVTTKAYNDSWSIDWGLIGGGGKHYKCFGY